jgi:hypothetical protein
VIPHHSAYAANASSSVTTSPPFGFAVLRIDRCRHGLAVLRGHQPQRLRRLLVAEVPDERVLVKPFDGPRVSVCQWPSTIRSYG